MLGKLLGIGNATKPALQAITDVINEVVETEEEKAAAKAVLLKIAQQPALLQAEINKIEAQHRSVFVAGWRPFIGWVSGLSLAFYFIPKFILASVLWVRISWEAQALAAYPVDGSDLFQVVFALLGMGTLRTLEKTTGVSK